MNNYKYQDVKEYLINLIKAHLNEENYILPSEKQIQVKLDVSSFTVKKAIKELKKDKIVYGKKGVGLFVSDDAGKYLSSDKKSHVVAVCLISSVNHFANAIQRGIMNKAEQYGIFPLFFYSDNNEKNETKFLEKIKSIDVSGAIIYPTDANYKNSVLEDLNKKAFPVVVVDRNVKQVGCSFVSTDHYKATFNATEQLIKQGKKRIAISIPMSISVSTMNERFRGYLDAHVSNNLSLDKRLFIDSCAPGGELIAKTSEPFPLNVEYMEKLTAYYLKFFDENSDIDAIITVNGISFISLLKAAKVMIANNKPIPDITVFDDDFDDISDLLGIPFTSIRQDGFKLGQIATEMLYKKITGKETEQKVYL